jgi:3-oxoacyl-[acyl-carrier protein] reductase
MIVDAGMEMQDRTALVTGGSRGIGKAICDVFTAKGLNVISPTRAELDLADEASIIKYLKHVNFDVDVLVNCAGMNTLSPISDLPMDLLKETFQVNFFSAVMILKKFLPLMQSRGYGRVVNIGSIYALNSRERRLPYSASKTALSALTRTAAIEYARSNIMVNSVLPGYVMTDMTAKNLSKDDLVQICERIPMGRLAQPEEIAKVGAFLCSEDNTYLTGQAIIVDGGFMVR